MNGGMRFTCWVLLLIFPAAMMTAEVTASAATLYGNGTVQINKSFVSRTSAVYAGDRVATGKDGLATLNSESMTVVLPGESGVLYQGKQLEMQYGRVLITARYGAEVRLGNLSIAPAETSANFRLQQNGARLTLAALSGTLNVSDGVYHAVLPAGQMMMQGALDTQDEPAPPSPRPKARSGGVPGWTVALIGAVTVGGIVGGLTAVGSSSGSTSPSKP